MVRDGAGETSPELIAVYEAMLESYNADPANKEKYADAYKTAYARIGSYAMQHGDNDKARECFSKLLEYEPENEAIKDILKKL